MATEEPRAVEVDPRPAEDEGFVEVDSAADADSAYGGDEANSYTTSLADSIFDYQFENGRTYHRYKEGSYWGPNDEREQDRLQLSHHVSSLALGGDLFKAPIGSNPQRILDIGTGTGDWAIDIADVFPSAEVIGTDLSPIQSKWIPPNLQFVIDDLEDTWPYQSSEPFDYIHLRSMIGSVSDWSKLLKQAYDHLKPGGWFELQDVDFASYSDDGSVTDASAFRRFIVDLKKAASTFGKPMDCIDEIPDLLKDSGFVDVAVHPYVIPHGPWPKDPRLKEVGRYCQVQSIEALPAYGLALFTRVLGWPIAEVELLLAEARNELKDHNFHSYTKIRCIIGRKPLSATDEGTSAPATTTELAPVLAGDSTSVPAVPATAPAAESAIEVAPAKAAS